MNDDPRVLLNSATRKLAAAGIVSARVDAELLLTHCLGVERSQLLLVDAVDTSTERRFEELVGRRVRREPLQHLVGHAPFRHLVLDVGPGVFIPRPETELLVDAVLPRLGRGSVVVDLCAGSGALALAVAQEVPGASVHAVERSPAAMQYLRRNAEGTGVHVHLADVSEPGLLDDLDATVDAVLCNPPYVPTGAVVAQEVAHDPQEAVFAGADGLGLIPTIFTLAARLLRDGGVLALEHDDSHGAAVVGLATTGEWRDAVDHDDLTGRPRYVTAIRAGRRAG